MSEQLSTPTIQIEGNAVGSEIIAGNGNKVYVIHQNFALNHQSISSVSKGNFCRNPYKGLDTFEENDAAFYFGRELQIERLWNRLQQLLEQQAVPKVLPILGPSGCGKSSLVRAGLIPEIAKRSHPHTNKVRVVIFVPGSHPLEVLASVLAKSATNDPAPLEKTAEFERVLSKPNDSGAFDGLRRIASVISKNQSATLVLVIDQFEEVYSLCKDVRERHIFIDVLFQAASESTSNVIVVFTLRSDFLGETQRHSALNNVIGSDISLIVPAMSASDLRRAIVEPARVVGQLLEESVVDLLVKDTQGREGALPLLQFSLTRIWEGMIAGRDPVDLYWEIGGVGGALAGKAQQIYEKLDSIQKIVAKQIFLELVHLEEGHLATRRRISVKELVREHDTSATVSQIIQRFASPDARLITLSSQSGNEIAEVTHESLIQNWETWQQWIEIDRDFRVWLNRLKRLRREWENLDKDEGALLRGASLTQAKEWISNRPFDVPKIEQDFVQASSLFQEKEIKNQLQRRRSVFMTVLAIALPIIFVGQAVVLRNSRTSLLITARQNLTTSAIRKAEELETGIQSVEATLSLLTQTEAFQNGDVTAIQDLIDRLSVPYTIHCVELKAPKNQVSVINNCISDVHEEDIQQWSDNPDGRTTSLWLRSIIPSVKQVPWLQQGSTGGANFHLFSPKFDTSSTEASIAATSADQALVKLIAASPIYSEENKLLYTLAMEIHLFQFQDATPQSLVGETVVIDQNQVVITHPDQTQVGKYISELRDASKFSGIISNVKAGKSDFVHFHHFLRIQDEEWLAGYSGFEVPVAPKQNKVWTVLAVTSLGHALHGLTAIRRVLLTLNVALIIAVVVLAKVASTKMK
ncbi:MAG: AAA family ATPase [Cyanobacteria bacterium J06650_10]